MHKGQHDAAVDSAFLSFLTPPVISHSVNNALSMWKGGVYSRSAEEPWKLCLVL